MLIICEQVIKLDEFVALSEGLLARMEPVIAQAIAQSGVPPAEITSVEIIGGSTRLGFVKVAPLSPQKKLAPKLVPALSQRIIRNASNSPSFSRVSSRAWRTS